MHIHGASSLLTLFATLALAQQPAAERTAPVIEPAALQALQATTDTLKSVEAFTFRAAIEREVVDGDGRVHTLTRQNEVAVKRPGKVRINITGQQDRLEVYFSNGELFVYAPEAKEYVGLGTSSLNLDTMVDRLEANNIALPMAPLFRSDPYRNMVEGLESAKDLGSAELDGKTFRHLSFVKKDVEWQLWVDSGTKPLPRRAQATYKTQPHETHMMIDFSDWNLNPDLAADYFTFTRPADVKAVPAISIDEVK